MGGLNIAFSAKPKKVEISFDPALQQQVLSFEMLLTVSIPSLLQELLACQKQDGAGQPSAVSSLVAQGGGQLVPSMEKPQLRSSQQVPASEASPLPSVEKPPFQLQKPSSEKLLQAVVHGDAASAAELLRQGADVVRPLPGPRRHTLLHAALEAGGRVDMVSLLLQAKCEVDALAADGKTPLHLAISQHAGLPPMAMRLLLSARADLTAADAANVTPLDCVRAIAKQPASISSPDVRQLLDEVSERPTVAVSVEQQEQVLVARFADTENEKVVFCTEHSLGLYSLSQRRTVWKLNLTQLRVQAEVRGMVVNPELGTISVLLEVDDGKSVQSLIIVWPSGHPLQEEPLKLGIGSSPSAERRGPPVVMSSSAKGPLTLISRICSGKVLCWCFNAACSQLISEFKITDVGGPVALSDDGHWLAVELREPGKSRQVEVWTFQRASKRLRKSPRRLISIDRRPEYLAIISQESGTSCLLAMAQETPTGDAPAPIEVLAIGLDGAMSSAYRVRQESPCRMLSFCYENPDLLLSGHVNGVVIVYNLPQAKLGLSHDDVAMRSACISTDGTLLVTAVKDCFRVFRNSQEARSWVRGLQAGPVIAC